MKSISIKLGLLFLSLILMIEVSLFLYLYQGLARTQINEELEALRLRGNSHREVLEKYYDAPTLNHVALMESKAETDVVITDSNGKILAHSNEINSEVKNMLTEELQEEVPYKGLIAQKDWKKQRYISTVSPIVINKEIVGYVHMFQYTKGIQDMILKLKHHFYVVGAFSVILSFVTIFLLSKIITLPLIRMKQATEKLSQGDFSVTLNQYSNDELGELGQSIQLLATDLQHLKKERNDFLSSISHELQTPLTYIKGYADIANRKETDPSQKEKYLAIIQEEAERVSNLVKDLFDLARLDQNTFTIRKEEVELHPYLDKIIKKINPMFEKKRIKLTYSCSNDVFIKVDPERFKQVIFNLLDNALKYSPSDTTVLLTVKIEEKEVLISIKDQGIGVPSDDLPFIFNRLYRVEKSRSRKSGGSGLGLSIVKEIVEAHGGRVMVKSELEKGTEMIIALERG